MTEKFIHEKLANGLIRLTPLPKQVDTKRISHEVSKLEHYFRSELTKTTETQNIEICLRIIEKIKAEL